MKKSEKSTEKILNQRREARDICKKILEFGVTEDQKIQIMIGLSLTLENVESMKEINTFLKKFDIGFNVEENNLKINKDNDNKILLN